MLGVGMWFWVIMGAGIFVAISQFTPMLQGFGTLVAGLLGIISVLAIFLTLLAATIGGSFKLEDNELLLLLSFFFVAVFGFSLVGINRRMRSREQR